jgi:hypothetical protein
MTRFPAATRPFALQSRSTLISAKLRIDAQGCSRDARSLCQTAISLRLERAPKLDRARWARTPPATIASFYDQTHPQLSVG